MNNSQWMYMVVDPFKIDYSPAKIRTPSEEGELYIQYFREAHRNLQVGVLNIWLKWSK